LGPVWRLGHHICCNHFLTHPFMQLSLPWLQPGDAFPDPAQAWSQNSQAPGLLAAGGALDLDSLQRAYTQGIFPWFSNDQPILWWSPDPRMTLAIDNFRLHRSLRKTLQHFRSHNHCEIRFNFAFDRVIQHCARVSRNAQSGTWIVPDMIAVYQALHRNAMAHSVETWVNGELVGGLYCVAIGRAVFGESMFALRTDASKIALAALVAFCRAHQIALIDCQQNTRHLASLGASEIPRSVFLKHVRASAALEPLMWGFDPLYWNHLLDL
jgi:leucyl/phenylalanyl-tRNA--protein transferase